MLHPKYPCRVIRRDESGYRYVHTFLTNYIHTEVLSMLRFYKDWMTSEEIAKRCEISHEKVIRALQHLDLNGAVDRTLDPVHGVYLFYPLG